MSEAVKNEPPISANQLSWTVWVGNVVVVLPYAVGFLYAIFALPLYAAACLGMTEREAVVGQVLKPIKEEDYLAFLAGKNCKAPPPQPLPPSTPCVAQGQPATILSVRSTRYCDRASEASMSATEVCTATSTTTPWRDC
jgi:hypothetical protein